MVAKCDQPFGDEFLLLSNHCYGCWINLKYDGWLWFSGFNNSCTATRKEIVLGFASHYFTPSCLQCSHY